MNLLPIRTIPQSDQSLLDLIVEELQKAKANQAMSLIPIQLIDL